MVVFFPVDSQDTIRLPGSVSSTIDKLHDTIVNSSITDDGYIAFDTDDGLGLAFGTDTEGRLVVKFHEEN